MLLETLLAVAFYYVFIVTVFGHALKMLERRMDVTSRAGPLTELPVAESPSVVAVAHHDERAPQEREKTIEAIGVRKSYGDHEVLKGINLAVRAGEVVSIIGPSGSGKTSLIRTMNGMESLSNGEIRVRDHSFLRAPGSDQGAVRHKDHMRGILDIGMVFQSFNLFPHQTVLQNVTLGPRYHHRGSAGELSQLGMEMLRKVGMAAHAKKYPHQLSGWQQQRVAIARALAMNPSIMLFDEPTSALDPERVNEVLKVIETLAKEGMTMVIVTHEIRFASRISDRLIFMESGVLAFDGTPQEAMNAAPDSRVASFLRQARAA